MRLNAPKLSLSSKDAALQEEVGVTFRLLSGAQIKPKGVLRVPRRMLTSTVRGFEEWQILEGTDWMPFEVNHQWLRFLTPKNQILDENAYIGYLQLEVSVAVSCEEVESGEEMATNVDLDDISTPRSRSSASSTSDIELVMILATCSRSTAVAALDANPGPAQPQAQPQSQSQTQQP